MKLDDGNGPVAWVLVIPTSYEIMNRFLSHEITEKQLLDETESGSLIDVVYLCSALVLDEYRRQGIAKQLCIEAIEKIRGGTSAESLVCLDFYEGGRATGGNGFQRG
jgi:GNAT superfamily N-acetyltransferase